MKVDLTMRTLIVSTWLVALLPAGLGADTGLLALAIVLVWAAPLLRDRNRLWRRLPSGRDADATPSETAAGLLAEHRGRS